jgi:NAD(P)-dependent dehydrogenase (short-subunit alcohol dehydrogenase family)
MKLRNDKIIVFGGGSGIGKAIAKRFCELGASVLITGRTEEKLISAAKEIASDRLFFKAFDITSKTDEHKALFEYAEKVLGGLNGFVNAAALGPDQALGRGYEPWDITEEEWDILSDTNYKAAFFLIRNEINYMLENNVRGNMLNIASNGAFMDIRGSYGSAKLAITRWTNSFGKIYGKNGIIINGIAPGATITPMVSRYAISPDQEYERHALNRFVLPEEIAELAFYLMSDFGEITCAHTVVADCGDNLSTL